MTSNGQYVGNWNSPLSLRTARFLSTATGAVPGLFQGVGAMPADEKVGGVPRQRYDGLVTEGRKLVFKIGDDALEILLLRTHSGRNANGEEPGCARRGRYRRLLQLCASGPVHGRQVEEHLLTGRRRDPPSAGARSG